MNQPFSPSKITELKITKVGNSAGVIVPKELLARLGVSIGDILDVTDTPAGVQLQRHDAGFAEQMKAAREVMNRRRNALSELAK